MKKDSYEQYQAADRILSSVCRVGGISFMLLCSYRKTEKLNVLRGVYCLMSRDMGVHPQKAAKLICRTRQNIINQARKYWHYMQVKDNYVTEIYKKVKENMYE